MTFRHCDFGHFAATNFGRQVFQLTLMAKWRCWELLPGQRTGQLKQWPLHHTEYDSSFVFKQLLQMSNGPSSKVVLFDVAPMDHDGPCHGWKQEPAIQLSSVDAKGEHAELVVGVAHVGISWNIIGNRCEYMSCGSV